MRRRKGVKNGEPVPVKEPQAPGMSPTGQCPEPCDIQVVVEQGKVERGMDSEDAVAASTACGQRSHIDSSIIDHLRVDSL